MPSTPARTLLLPVLLAVLCTAAPAAAQITPGALPPRPGPDLTARVGWQWNGNVSTSAGTVVVQSAPSYGLVLDVPIRPGITAEVMYLYSATDARFDSRSIGYPSSRSFNVDIHYLQVGGYQGFRQGRVEPFLAGSLGAAVFVPGTIDFQTGGSTSTSSTWHFALTGGGGVKLHLSERVLVRLEARLLLPIYFSGAAFYAGTGGSGMSVSGGVPLLQGDFSGGLGVAF